MLFRSQNELNNTKNQLAVTQGTLHGMQSNPTAPENMKISGSLSHQGPRLKNPDPFTGKGSIRSWITHMDNYLGNTSGDRELSIAVSYLEDHAHEWWIALHHSQEGVMIQNWGQLKEALLSRFETLNRTKIARDKLSRWRQIKDVPSFNNGFQSILLDIPNISIDEQIDRYSRGLKSYIWKELCTKDYKKLSELMQDAERVESAHKRTRREFLPMQSPNPVLRSSRAEDPTPIDIGGIDAKLTLPEKELCIKEGRCFRCHQKGHIASNCPKDTGN